jgi:hypothetical protein
MAPKLHQPSWRGVPFEVESTDDEPGGARNVKHEFPGRKEAYGEPNGEYAGRFPLDGHVIGPDYIAKRDALEEALAVPGPGKLVHPTRGPLLVSLESPPRVHWSSDKGGMFRFSMVFFESAPASAPVQTIDTASKIEALKPIVYLHIGGDSRLNVSGPDFLATAARLILAGPRGLTTELSKVNNRMSAAFNLVDDVRSSIVDLGNEVGTLVRTPETLAIKLQGLVNGIFTAVGAAGFDLNRGDKQRNTSRVASTLSALTTLGTFGDTQPPVPAPDGVANLTATRRRQLLNQNALIDMIEVTGLVEGVGALADLPLDNAAQAGDVLSAVNDVFDRIQDRGSLPDSISKPLRDLKATFLAHLRNQTVVESGLGRYTPPLAAPALVIAYQLYGDASRDQEIVDRNRIEHPCFVPGGVELAVADG